MRRQDYLDTLRDFIDAPENTGFGDNIIPVAMWLRGFMPGDEECSICNKSSLMIRSLLGDIVDVDLNDISRLMIMNGYSLNSSGTNPEWMMKPIEKDDPADGDAGQE